MYMFWLFRLRLQSHYILIQKLTKSFALLNLVRGSVTEVEQLAEIWSIYNGLYILFSIV